MALPHLQPGEKVALLPQNDAQHTLSVALFKSQHLEVVRFAMQAGQGLPLHRVPGEITIQCLSGRMAVQHGAPSVTTELQASDLLLLAGNDPHAVQALEPCVFLVTIALVPPAPAP